MSHHRVPWGTCTCGCLLCISHGALSTLVTKQQAESGSSRLRHSINTRQASAVHIPAGVEVSLRVDEPPGAPVVSRHGEE
jgi:hypothetical protein